MVLQLFGVNFSVSSRRAFVVAKELNAPYELVPIDIFKGEHKSEATLKNQPFGQLPYLRDPDTGFTLYESRAIARYLVARFDKDGKSGLVPTDANKLAKFEQAASVELTKFEPHVGALAVELVFKPVVFNQPTDQAVVDKHLSALNATLDVYEGILTKQKYLAGDDCTLVDLFHLPVGTLLTDTVKLDVLVTDKRPNVLRWWKAIYSRPTWAVVKADSAPLRMLVSAEAK